MSLATTAMVVGIAGGVNSLTGGGITSALGMGPKSATGAQAQQAADPFSPYRDNLAQMYSGALQPGQSADIQKMPGYSQYKTGVLDPAMEASKRSAAGSGMLYSGNEQQALQKTGQQGYYGFMTDYMNRLAQGSGAVNNPAQAAGMGLAQAGSNQQGVMQGLGGIATGLSGLSGQFGGSAGAWTDPMSGGGAQFGFDPSGGASASGVAPADLSSFYG